MDPRHVLLPPATGPPTPRRNGGSIFAERAALAVEHDPGAHEYDAHPQLARPRGLGLPRDADLREEVAPRRRILVERLFPARAVVADGGAADKFAGHHPGRRPQAGRLEPREQVTGAGYTTLANRPLGPLAPALGDVLAGEVHDRVPTGERRDRGRLGERIPAHGLDAQRLPRASRVSREDRDLVAALAQLRYERAADQAACSRDGHAHASTPFPG